jgi:hypothetical protein
MNCKWVFPSGKDCTAYPDGIPIEILDGTISHEESLNGDHGFVFSDREVEGSDSTENIDKLNRVISDLKDGNITDETILSLKSVLSDANNLYKNEDDSKSESSELDNIFGDIDENGVTEESLNSLESAIDGMAGIEGEKKNEFSTKKGSFGMSNLLEDEWEVGNEEE